MKLEQAIVIAEQVKSTLASYCSRIEIAGSIRRKKPEVKNIEIVCVIDEKQYTHFWMAIVQGFKRIIKGQPGGKYTQVKVTDEIVADIFICHETNWGYIFAIRTGSADYSHHVLANGWVKKGYKGWEGFLWKLGGRFEKKQRIEIREEQELFDLIGIPFCEPEKRSWPQ